MKRLLLSLISLLAMHAAWAQCTASFTTSAQPFGNTLLNYSFTNTSTTTLNPPQYYSLYTVDYGDGSTTYGGIYLPSHSYAAPGTYNLSLEMEVTDSNTNTIVCTDVFNTTLTVAYSSCGSQVSSTNMGGGVFNFSATNPAGTPGVTYAWDFGDGTTSTLQNPTHTYTSNGNFVVMLITNGGGCQYLNEFVITNGNNQINCSGLDANFTASVSANTVSFTNTSTPSNVPSVYVTSNWYFGDGDTSWFDSPTHSYATAGTYTVTLFNVWVDSFSNTYCIDSSTQTVTVGTPPPPIYSINGYIFYDSLLSPSADFMVYLIQMDSQANTLNAVDSQIVAAWSVGSYSFVSPAAGNYLVKAAALGQTIGGAGMVPTYHDSSLYWSNAPYLFFSGAANAYNVNIWMQNGIVTSGPGFVGGNISQGANKGTTNGVPGIVVYLRNSTNDLIASGVTDGNGDYSFSNIPSGIYNVYPEDMGLATTPSGNLTVYSSGQTSVTGVDFVRNSTSIVPVTLSVGEVEGSNVFALYPNPAQNSITLTTKAAANVTITNATGAIVIQVKVKGGSEQLSLNTLPVGLYMVKVQSGAAVQTSKLLMQR